MGKAAKKARQSAWKIATVAADWENSTQPSPSKPATQTDIQKAMDTKARLTDKWTNLKAQDQEELKKANQILEDAGVIPRHKMSKAEKEEKATKIKGIFFGATGCFHQAGDFFEPVHEDGWEFKDCAKSKLMRCQG